MNIDLHPNWFVRVGDATSQWLNAALFKGNANESLSGRAFREDRQRVMKVIDTICFWEDDHCAVAHFTDYARAQDFIEQENLRSNKWQSYTQTL